MKALNMAVQVGRVLLVSYILDAALIYIEGPGNRDFYRVIAVLIASLAVAGKWEEPK